MKSYFFRLSRNWLFWALIVIQVLVVVCYSVYYAKNVYNSHERWNHSIVKYKNVSDLETQKNILLSQIEDLNKETDKSHGSVRRLVQVPCPSSPMRAGCSSTTV